MTIQFPDRGGSWDDFSAINRMDNETLYRILLKMVARNLEKPATWPGRRVHLVRMAAVRCKLGLISTREFAWIYRTRNS